MGVSQAAWILWLTLIPASARPRCEANSTDALELLQVGDGRRVAFPPGCFVLEDHFQVDWGVLVGFLRFGAWGNAGPSDVRCIASRDVTNIVGGLSVTGALSLTSILLPNLEVVRGSLAFTQLPMLQSESFRLPALARVNENLVFRATNLSALSLPRLWRVGRTLELRSNSLLDTVALSSLVFVELHLVIDSNPLLELLNCPRLQQISYDLIIEGNQRLQDISFEVLSVIGKDLKIFVLDDFRSLRLPKLVSVGEDARLGNLMSLKHLELPKLKFIGEDLKVYNAYALECLSMPSLLYVKDQIHHLGSCIGRHALDC